MSKNTFQKPVLVKTSAGSDKNCSSVASSSANQEIVPNSVIIQNPENVFFIYGQQSVSQAPAIAESEQRLQKLEGRVVAAIEKFEKMINSNEKKVAPQPAFIFGRPSAANSSMFQRPSTAGGVPRKNIFDGEMKSFDDFFKSQRQQVEKSVFEKAKEQFEGLNKPAYQPIFHLPEITDDDLQPASSQPRVPQFGSNQSKFFSKKNDAFGKHE